MTQESDKVYQTPVQVSIQNFTIIMSKVYYICNKF